MARNPTLVIDRDNSVAALLRRLRHDGLQLLRAELSIARAELALSANKLARGAIAGVVGAVLLLAGLLALVATAIIVLDIWLPLWLAACAVGLVLLVAGMLTLRAARKGFDAESLALTHTRHSVQQDLDLIKRTAHEQPHSQHHGPSLDPGARAAHGRAAGASG